MIGTRIKEIRGKSSKWIMLMAKRTICVCVLGCDPKIGAIYDLEFSLLWEACKEMLLVELCSKSGIDISRLGHTFKDKHEDEYSKCMTGTMNKVCVYVYIQQFPLLPVITRNITQQLSIF